jgi:signal transduction histidine kinase
MASIAAIHFSPDELDRIHGPTSVGSPDYEQAVRKLAEIRAQAPNIRYAYILRRTANPGTMEFVADADSLHPDEAVDLNQDGAIDEEDALTYPGDPYDVSEFPEFQRDAFERPFVDPDFTVSQWGIFLAGTAPIRYVAAPERPTAYVIGLDLEVTQYEQLLDRVFLPFVAFAFFLLAVITLQAVALRQLWNRQVRQLVEIDRQKDELIGIVSHQLATPITSVRWNLQDMLDGEFGEILPEQRKHVAEVLRAVENLNELTQLLLDVSRIELGRMKMRKESVDLGRFFADLLVLIDEPAKQKQIHLIPVLPGVWPPAMLDPRLTRMTLENLLSNAVKYSPAGGSVTLTVEVRGNLLVARVTDTGLGIPKADQPHIFEKLYRATNTQQIEGNGFGLYVAKGAVEQQGGRLWFTSQEGRGTTFFVELPLA